MQTFTDQTGFSFVLEHYPFRIVSVVPSQTELLAYLGFSEEIMGITKFCVHPDSWFRQKPRVGGTKTLNVEKIKSLHPDIVIANKEENDKEQVELIKRFCPVWTSNIQSLNDSLEMILEIGKLTNTEEKASELVGLITTRFNALEKEIKKESYDCLKAAYLIWNDPFMATGGDTFIHSMMEKCGLQNVFSHKVRYPEISIEELKELNCKLLLLSSEPYPFKEKDALQIQAHFPDLRILLVDGKMFSWYGSRLLYAPEYFLELREALNLPGE